MSFKFLGPLALVASALLLASCGGSSGQIEPFVPTRVIAFGDELSVIQTDGRKYSINAFRQIDVGGVPTDDPTTVDCTRNPLWIQIVATNSGLAFDKCASAGTTATGQIQGPPLLRQNRLELRHQAGRRHRRALCRVSIPRVPGLSIVIRHFVG